MSPHGAAGELRVQVISDSPGRFAAGGVLYLGNERLRIERASPPSRGSVVLMLEGIDTRGRAASLKGALLMVPEAMVPPLPEGEYYHFQVLGMSVYDPEGRRLGRVTEILSTGTNDVYVVSEGGREVLVPALEGVVRSVDVGARRMTVELPEGLKPDA